MRVSLKIRDPGEYEEENTKKLQFGRIPMVGEYIAISNSVHWYKVVLVLHTPYLTEFDEAEVWCVKTTLTAAVKATEF